MRAVDCSWSVVLFVLNLSFSSFSFSPFPFPPSSLIIFNTTMVEHHARRLLEGDHILAIGPNPLDLMDNAGLLSVRNGGWGGRLVDWSVSCFACAGDARARLITYRVVWNSPPPALLSRFALSYSTPCPCPLRMPLRLYLCCSATLCPRLHLSLAFTCCTRTHARTRTRTRRRLTTL